MLSRLPGSTSRFARSPGVVRPYGRGMTVIVFQSQYWEYFAKVGMRFVYVCVEAQKVDTMRQLNMVAYFLRVWQRALVANALHWTNEEQQQQQIQKVN